ncbi:hypothetical protein ACVJGD_008148 [Bradyrhizobium sp. USDA 10063]
MPKICTVVAYDILRSYHSRIKDALPDPAGANGDQLLSQYRNGTQGKESAALPHHEAK